MKLWLSEKATKQLREKKGREPTPEELKRAEARARKRAELQEKKDKRNALRQRAKDNEQTLKNAIDEVEVLEQELSSSVKDYHEREQQMRSQLKTLHATSKRLAIELEKVGREITSTTDKLAKMKTPEALNTQLADSKGLISDMWGRCLDAWDKTGKAYWKRHHDRNLKRRVKKFLGLPIES